jgi:hypothetical protein
MQVVKELDSAASAGWLQYKLAKTMQALAARTTSSYSCTARFCPEYQQHSLRHSDTIDPRRASIRVSSRAIVSSSSDIFFRVPVFSTL